MSLGTIYKDLGNLDQALVSILKSIEILKMLMLTST